MNWGYLVIIGIVLIVLGMLLVFIGTFLSALERGGKVEGGGVLVIGPLPIIFGTSATAAIAVAVIALLIMIVALLIMYLRPSP
ncbi:MAG: DUF131 domain-containing protein [Acidilobaceae archaeon]|nr:DUF131 domain-containing protein [Acidilobaceae archaeon]